MNVIYELFPEELIKAMGWTIFHSIWQGTVIAIILGSILLMTRTNNSKLRYYLSSISLFVMFGIALFTFIRVYNSNIEISNGVLNTVANTYSTSKDSPESPAVISDSGLDIALVLKSYFANNLSLIVTIWLAGFLLFSLRFMGGVLYLQRLRKTAYDISDEFWTRRVKELSHKFNLNKLVRIFESRKVKTPVTVGYLKPIILLPIGMLTGLPQEQVEAIIIHELAHIKRYDFLVNLLQTFIETIFFYHPVVWWISSTMKSERENCCDDLTLNLCGGSLIYFKALYNMQQICLEESELALAVIGKKNQLFRRINRMNSSNRNTSYGIKFAAFGILLIMILAASLYSNSSAKEYSPALNKASFVNPISGLNSDVTISEIGSDGIVVTDTTSIKKGTRTLKFSENDKRYKASLKEGKLEDLYIDGQKVEQKDLSKYEKMVNDRLGEYDSSMKEYRESMKAHKEKMKQFRDKMKKFRGTREFSHDSDFDFDIEIPEIPDINIDIPDMDTTQLKNILKDVQKSVHESLSRHPVKIPHIHIPKMDFRNFHHDLDDSSFNKEEFKQSMKEWSKKFKKEMEKWKFENEGFKEEMEKFKEEMQKNGPNSEAFKKSMEDLKGNMANLKIEMKKLKDFIHATKNELVKDKLMNEGDELEDFTLSKDEMVIDGKKVSSELHKKYLEMYKIYFGRELTGDKKFRVND